MKGKFTSFAIFIHYVDAVTLRVTSDYCSYFRLGMVGIKPSFIKKN